MAQPAQPAAAPALTEDGVEGLGARGVGGEAVADAVGEAMTAGGVGEGDTVADGGAGAGEGSGAQV